MLTRDSLLFSPTRDGVPSSDDNFTAGDLVAAQDALEAEAREVIPYTFSHCTGDMGYIKQPVFACRTCLNDAGVCAGCSLGCHAEHELVELFTRRSFKCDCGTERMGAGSFCSLSKRDDAPANADNTYSKNFKGEFCICGVLYDPHTETDAMYQCLVCEDWLHHACLFGTHSDAEASPLGTDDFDMLICAGCVVGNPHLKRVLDRWAGVEGRGMMMIGKDDKVLGRTVAVDEEEDGDLPSDGEGNPAVPDPETTKKESSNTVEKRKAESQEVGDLDPPSTEEERAMKKSRHVGRDSTGNSSLASSWSSTSSATAPASETSSSTVASSSASASTIVCIAPPNLPSGTSVLAKLEKEGARLNVYLDDGWMERWCRCRECLSYLHRFPYLLEEEDIYDPPEDPDAHKSTLELGMEALSRMPRAQALDGVAAFAGLSERLKTFLRPHALAGETITKTMVDTFFAEERERQHREH